MTVETSLLINGGFALRQQDSKPVLTLIGEKVDRPYNESEIKNSIDQLIKLDIKAGKSKDETDKRSLEFEKYLKEHTKKTDGKKNYPIDLNKLERIILTPLARGYISTAFIDFCKEHKIAIYWIDSHGIIEASFIPIYFKKPTMIIKQCKAHDNGIALQIAKYLIKLKLESQGMNHLIAKLDTATTIKNVLQIEGIASRWYFKSWPIGKEWNFNGRHGRQNNDNDNAIDAFNSLLNFGYGLLAQRMSEILLKRGFELSIGFLHLDVKDRYYNQLTYDFIEPFRVWIDDSIKGMITAKKITPNDFTFKEDKSSMVFKDNGFKIALNRFLETLEPLEFKSLPMIREIEKRLS